MIENKNPPFHKSACPCNSGKPFEKCCQVFLDGKKKPPTVAKLMRSRYSAFSLGGYGEYLLATWHPDYRGQLNEHELSILSTHWVDLKIVSSTQKGETGEVEFIARFENSDGTTSIHHENSNFIRKKGMWLYCDGQIKPHNSGDQAR